MFLTGTSNAVCLPGAYPLDNGVTRRVSRSAGVSPVHWFGSMPLLTRQPRRCVRSSHSTLCHVSEVSGNDPQPNADVRVHVAGSATNVLRVWITPGREERCDLVDVAFGFLHVGEVGAVVEDAEACVWEPGGEVAASVDSGVAIPEANKD